MWAVLDTFKKIRASTVLSLQAIPEEKWHIVPSGFQNNIIWHAGHLAAVQQILIYKRSDVASRLTDEWLDVFRKGTSPLEQQIGISVGSVLQVLTDSIAWLEEDISKNIFTNYNSYVTSTGVTLDSAEKALLYVLYHEGVHQGSISALKKLVG